MDLPAPRASGNARGGFGEIDLPVASRPGLPALSQRDLPAVGGPGLPAVGSEIGLPAQSRADLPAPAAGLPLAAHGSGSGLPSAARGVEPAFPYGCAAASTSVRSGPDQGHPPGSRGPPPGSRPQATNGESSIFRARRLLLSPPMPRRRTAAAADLWDQPVPEAPPRASNGRRAAGTNYGEVNLEAAPPRQRHRSRRRKTTWSSARFRRKPAAPEGARTGRRERPGRFACADDGAAAASGSAPARPARAALDARCAGGRRSGRRSAGTGSLDRTLRLVLGERSAQGRRTPAVDRGHCAAFPRSSGQRLVPGSTRARWI